ncbi:MAG: SLBB domain-containing protein [Candidatus Omnitrophica bacterium]|nr:SLBB domain-containing protein [Candidatus Omnitrophota bacterium]
MFKRSKVVFICATTLVSLIIPYSLSLTTVNSYAATPRWSVDDSDEKRVQDDLDSTEFKKLECPYCKKSFEVLIDPTDIDLRKGLKPFICPYGGKEFYQASEETAISKEKEIYYGLIKSPNSGMYFKAEIDLKALFSGESQIFVSPYSGDKFYFKPMLLSEGGSDMQMSGSTDLICPTCGNPFKAFVDPSNPKPVVCPYDGTQISMAVNAAMGGGVPTGIGGIQSVSGGQIPQLMGFKTRSLIEQAFAGKIPSFIPRNLTQFGYDLFPTEEEMRLRSMRDDRKFEGDDVSSSDKIKELVNNNKGISDYRTGGFGSSQFKAQANVMVNSDYVIGPDDEMIISVWGNMQEVFKVTVDKEGKINLPKSGPLYVWGLKFKDCEELIKGKLSKHYSNLYISVSMGRLRLIEVFVLGEVVKPGSHSLSALSDIFHTLYIAGGPKKMGTMRRIQFLKDGGEAKVVDLYDILISGRKITDCKLESGDTIFVPPIGGAVGIAGSVKRPAIYEIKEDLSLADLIKMSGGISSVGYLNRIQVERVKEHSELVVFDLEFASEDELDSSSKDIRLQDGDLVLVYPISQLKRNYVSISGNVTRPAEYEFKEGMTVKELLEKAGGILPGTYLERAEIYRFKDDNTREIISFEIDALMKGEADDIALKEWDNLRVYGRSEILSTQYVSVDGAVQKGGRFILSSGMKVSDLIFKGGGLKETASLANAELFRTTSGSGPELIKVDVDKVYSGDEAYDITLKDNDHLFVREVISGQKRVIEVTGEVNYPGKYAVSQGERLSSVLQRAGGFKESAYLDGAFLSRVSVKEVQEKMVRQFLEMEQKALLAEQSSMSVGVSDTQSQARMQVLEYRSDLIHKLSNVDIPGRMILKLDRMDKFTGSPYDIVIEDGDKLHIPSRPSTVLVVGNVYHSSAIAFMGNRGVNYYLNKVGGLTKNADSKGIYIIKASGESDTTFVSARKVSPGDTIIVPEKYIYKTPTGILLRDIAKVIYEVGLGAAVAMAALD